MLAVSLPLLLLLLMLLVGLFGLMLSAGGTPRYCCTRVGQAGEHDPSSFYPSFQLDCLRQPHGDPTSPSAASPGAGSRGSRTSTAMDDDDDDDHHRACLRSMGGGDDEDPSAHAPSPCPARLKMDGGGGGGGCGGVRRGSGLGGFAAALEEVRGDGAAAAGAGAGVPETPLRRPGSGARRRVMDRGADGSCSPVGGRAGLDRWVWLSGAEGGREDGRKKVESVREFFLSLDIILKRVQVAVLVCNC